MAIHISIHLLLVFLHTLVYLRILSFEVAIKLNRTFETRCEKMVPWQQWDCLIDEYEHQIPLKCTILGLAKKIE